MEGLYILCDPLEFEFETTEEVPPLEDIIGQERAVKAMDFGLRIKQHGYNIYISGITGTGKNSYARSLIKEIAAGEDVPDDWCYVYNFKKPEEPIALNFPAGEGAVFARNMENFIAELKEAIPNAFSSEDYDRKKTEYIKEYQDIRTALMDKLNRIASEKGFLLKKTSSGFVTVPVVDDKQVSEQDYDKLPEETKEELEARSNEVQLKALEILRKIQGAEKELRKKIKKMDREIALMAIGHFFEEMNEEYRDHTKVMNYLHDFREDVLNNIGIFRADEEDSSHEPLAWLGRQSKQREIRYKVNLLVDNQDRKGAPVEIEHNPFYYNMIGRVEYENRMGMVLTDFTMIKGGALHRANGGYLILQALDVLNSLQSWEVIKRVLKTKKITIENIAEQYGLVAMSTLKPEPIPLNTKVIMIGSQLIYQLLYHYDEDFRKLFKIKADFDVEMKRDRVNMTKMASFISAHCRKEKLKHFDREAVARVVDYGSRLAEDREKISTRFNDIVEILYEADAWAGVEGDDLVSGGHVQKAITEKIYRSNKLENKIQELVEKEQILLDVEGSAVGQINGLSVVDLGDYRFGYPTRITASTFLGRQGIINIERESELSGKIYNKAVLIIGGFIGHRYAQKVPLSLSASICFEQSYSGVEGDSASVAELLAILSSLAEVPLRQGVAVSGSVNQKGEVQPVGGINQKIEGFYHTCRVKGLDGDQGVVIPAANYSNLMLSPEVVEAVKEGLFSVYLVNDIDEAVELMTGMAPGTMQEDGTFPEGTFNYLVQEKLLHYHRLIGKKDEDEQNGMKKD
ncbi:MAG: AAA family ATPase [Firmicutes bacterium]|nr:AAA family ATPase [Bacillota bacterium]